MLAPLLPRRTRYALRYLRHQVRSGAMALRAPHRPVFETRHPPEALAALARAARRDTPRPRSLSVLEVHRPTNDSVHLVLTNPADDPVYFRPGQFLTVTIDVDGETYRRQYSFCGAQGDERAVEIAVRRVPGGVVSNHLVDNAVPGMVLRTEGPSGRFGTEVDPGNARRVVLVAGGAGITPLLAIARAVIAVEPRSSVHLVYANRGVTRVMFRDALDALAARSDGRFTIRHVLERASRSLASEPGRLSGDVLAQAIPVDRDATYFVCGPTPMMNGVVSYLGGAGVAGEAIHVERFTRAIDTAPSDDTSYPVRFARSGVEVDVRSDETLLEAGLRAGVAMPFSCTMGGCAACKCRVQSGKVHMPDPNCLSTDEARRGEVLTCIARPRSPLTLDA